MIIFNRINPDRSIPTTETGYCVVKRFDEFQSYQSKQINPDEQKHAWETRYHSRVSIVSIQTDQSRPSRGSAWLLPPTPSFNRINPNRSIPTSLAPRMRQQEIPFQSYQSKQINPDQKSITLITLFNGGVSIVSIQTDQSRQ